MQSTKRTEIERYTEVAIHPWIDGNYEYKLTIQYGMHYIWNNSEPYFSITGSSCCRRKGTSSWRWDSGGCLHDLITAREPKLAELIRFHLYEQSGLPLYYVENSEYHYKQSRGWYSLFGKREAPTREERQKSWSHFSNYVLLEKGERLPKISSAADMHKLTAWLEARKPKIQSQFHDCMKRFEVEYITPVEIRNLKERMAATRPAAK